MADIETKPETPQQAKQLLSENPERSAVYIFVPKLRTDNALAQSLNGFRGELKVVDMVSGQTIAILPTKHGIKLDLLPNHTYMLNMGEYWQAADYQDQADWAMELEISTKTLGTDSFKAFDVYTDGVNHIQKADIKRLTTAETLQRLADYKLMPIKMPMDELAFSTQETKTLFDNCLTQSDLTVCESSLAGMPDSQIPPAVAEHVAQLRAESEQKQALADLEASLPVQVRRDKYMVQLSQHLKQQEYAQALPLFEKLQALPDKADPSLKYFYGEALLKTSQPAAALKQLYSYISEQGSNAPHYSRALELINQAEAAL
ncbi:tetratricopeptide repeat protein [Methylophaga sp. OBS3]|uniref:tetratricopeptide repeat protein n=1 Tax=Methylophaga sp. OBS3 TaxID=2991934 RepID=UPI00224ED90A|nr:tetratricopeptide repeat protein [Methylophaga sp. OBS3]MCX4190662.1 tetratricopeptide repeat protein [Methylophaga sp. OBS3]